MAPQARPSLKTIATELGLSITTVSRALGKGERISEGTVRRVREAAHRLGYVRNQAAVKLRTGRTMRVFLLFGAGSEGDLADTRALSLYSGVFERFKSTNYSLRLVPLHSRAGGMQMLEEIVEGRLGDGVILNQVELEDPRLIYLEQAQLPYVTLGKSELPFSHAHFEIDPRFSAWQSTDGLLHRGARRVGMLSPPPQRAVSKQRALGFEEAFAAHGLRDPEAWTRVVEPGPDAAWVAATELMQAGADGLVCQSEVSMLGALAAARDLGRRPGRDLFIATRAGGKLAHYLSVPVLLSYFSDVEAGRTLAELLLARLEGTPADQLCKRARTNLIDTGYLVS